MGLLSSVASSVGKLFTQITGAQQLQQDSQNFNSAEAAKNRQWLEQMSNTAHQREIKDLKAAGLNPILSAGGAGATTPGASPASAGTSSGVGDPISAISSAADIVKRWSLADSEKKKNEADAAKAKADAGYTKETKTKQTNKDIEKMQSEIGLNSAKTDLIDSQKDLIGSQIELNSAKSLLTRQQKETEKENTTKVHNEAWESLHRSNKYDSERAKNYGTPQGQAGLIYEGRHKYIKLKK